MISVTCRKAFGESLIRIKRSHRFIQRHLLSPSYQCNEEWDKRLESPLLAKVNLGKLFNDITSRFNRKAKVNAGDIDLFVNAINNPEYLQDSEHILKRFRRTWRTKDTLESTHHAVIRAYLKYDRATDLLNILEQRIEYGIFPDDYCYNLLLDHFIERKDFRNASRVAILKMIQEDFTNPIGNILCLEALNKYVYDGDRIPILDTPPEPTNEEEGEDDVVYVRVPFLRNPFFDDHFDLKEDNHLLGKTMYLLGREFEDVAGRSFQLHGLSMYGKWEKARNVLKCFVDTRCEPVFSVDIVKPVQALVESVSEEKKDVATAFLNDLTAVENKASNVSLATVIQEKVEAISGLESVDINAMKDMYSDFEKKRQAVIEEQLYELTREQKKKEIEEKIERMKRKERELFFFENFNRIEMEYDDAVKAIEEAKKSSSVDEDYIPPEV